MVTTLPGGSSDSLSAIVVPYVHFSCCPRNTQKCILLAECLRQWSDSSRCEALSSTPVPKEKKNYLGMKMASIYTMSVKEGID
jgi:hypothetical protein